MNFRFERFEGVRLEVWHGFSIASGLVLTTAQRGLHRKACMVVHAYTQAKLKTQKLTSNIKRRPFIGFRMVFFIACFSSILNRI